MLGVVQRHPECVEQEGGICAWSPRVRNQSDLTVPSVSLTEDDVDVVYLAIVG
jgi:hypothetical protein